MKIAQVAPLWESVPPQCYGGTERIVSYLTEELVRLGHDVTLFATGDSVTAAKLEAIYPQALRLATGLLCREAPIFLELERAFGAKSDQFDLIHRDSRVAQVCADLGFRGHDEFPVLIFHVMTLLIHHAMHELR